MNQYDSGINIGGGILQETLKSSFLFSFRTGNVIIDTFITGFVICISTYIMGLCGRIQYLNWRMIVFPWFGITEEKQRRIVISSKPGNQFSDNRAGGSNYSPLFNSILHRIKKLDCDQSDIVEMTEIPVLSPGKNESKKAKMLRQAYGYNNSGHIINSNEYEIDNMELESKNRTNLVVSQSKRFRLCKNVFGTVKTFNSMQQNKPNRNQRDFYGDQGNINKETTTEYEIVIESTVLSMNDLRSLVQTWVKEYLQFMEPNEGLHYFQYQPKSSNEDCCNSIPNNNFAEYRFESSKRFENLFFPSKGDLIDRLNHFHDNETWYHNKGLPHTLGFLFYGEPGCGKTSTIKAIANYTKRHIVSISLAKVKSQKELFDIFYNDYINDRKVPIGKRLYVLEDIDCNKLEDIVGDRSKKKDKEISIEEAANKSMNINLALPATMSQQGVVTIGNEKPELTLADILETLDGVMEMDGRMLVITSNYPDKLDAALIRPGRIDVQLKFGRCTSNALLEMYEHFCGSSLSTGGIDIDNSIWPKNFNKASLLADKWTPAQVTQVLLRNIRSPIDGLYELQKEPKSNQF